MQVQLEVKLDTCVALRIVEHAIMRLHEYLTESLPSMFRNAIARYIQCTLHDLIMHDTLMHK